MFEQAIAEADVEYVLSSGEEIRAYPEDKPYPSKLVLGWVGNRPLHVVAAEHTAAGETIIITVYEPDPLRWDASFRRRLRQ
jgi:hypothetical protein